MELEIDLDKVIRSKNPKAARFLPRFIINYLKRVIHQDEINYCLREFSDEYGINFIDRVLNYVDVKHRSFGLDDISSTGRYVFASNHPLGGLDGLILALEIEKKFGNVKLVVNDLLMNLGPLMPLFVPVNKFGKQSVEYARALNELFKSDEQIIYFPFGLCSRKIKGKIQDGEWKKNFITKAIEGKRDIVPVFVDSQNSSFFYNLSSIRKKIGVKVNIEMIYLPDEFFKKRGSQIDIYYGQPISWEKFIGKDHKQAAQEIRNIVYNLKTDL